MGRARPVSPWTATNTATLKGANTKWGFSVPADPMVGRRYRKSSRRRPSPKPTSQRLAAQELWCKTYPQIGGGLVNDGLGKFFLAGTGQYSYSGGIGGAKGDPAYIPALVEVAKVIASRD